MKDWKLDVDAREDGIYVEILKGQKIVGSLYTEVSSVNGVKSCEIVSLFLEKPQYQQEFIRDHYGLKVGEAMALALYRKLAGKGIKYIRRGRIMTRRSEEFLERLKSAGFLKESHRGLLEIRALPEKKAEAARRLRKAERKNKGMLRMLRERFKRRAR